MYSESGRNDAVPHQNEQGKPERKKHPAAGRVKRCEEKMRPRFASKFVLYRLDLIIVAVVFTIALLGALLGEKITVEDGFGFDGDYYGELSMSFSVNTIVNHHIDSYHIQRIVPSIVVHYALRLFQLPLTTENVILGFALLNVVLITLGAVCWCLISQHVQVGSSGRIIGACAIFISFALTKWPSFYPVLTDVAGFAISIGMLFFYLKNNRLVLLLLTILGAFTWPTLIYEGVLFLLFPKSAPEENAPWRPAPHRLNWWSALAAGMALAVAIQWVILHYQPTTLIVPYKPLIPVSILVAGLYFFFALAMLLDNARLFSLKYWLSHFRWKAWLPVLLCVSGAVIVQKIFSTPNPDINTIFRNILILPVTLPGKFMVAHVFFFGPAVLLMLFYWKSMTRFVQNQGLGLSLNLILGLLLLLSTESRGAINFLPLFVLPLAQVVDAQKWRPAMMWLIPALAVVFSRVWLPLNDTPFTSKLISLIPYNLLGNNLFPEYPLNPFYWASNGAWTTHRMYVFQTVLTILTGAAIFAVTKVEARINHRKRES